MSTTKTLNSVKNPSIIDKTALQHLDPENARSLYNISPPVVQRALKQTPKEILTLSEHELKERLKPSYEMSLLRFRFFEEYIQAQTHSRKISLKNVLKGSATPQYFESLLEKSAEAVAWIVMPPKDYHLMISESMVLGFQRIRDILELPLFDKKGEPNTKVADTILKAVGVLENRVFGPQTQKLDVRQVTHNLTQNSAHQSPSLHNMGPHETANTQKLIEQGAEDLDLDVIEKKIKELKS